MTALGLDLLENLHDVLGHVGVEAGGRLVAEHERRVGQHLRSEGQPLALAAGNSLDAALDADQGVGAFRQAELEGHVKCVCAFLQYLKKKWEIRSTMFCTIGVKQQMLKT